jgi:phosphoglycerate dehydrogenase-like enzyme
LHKLLIVSPEAERFRDRIRQAEPDLEMKVFRDGDAESADFAREADVMLAWKFPRRLLSAMPRLRWIQSVGAGVDHIMAARPLPDGVLVTRMVDIFSDAMAEYVLGYMFAATLQVPRVLAQQRERRWLPFASPLLREKTAVVVGLGSIGREICRTLRLAGLRLIGVSRGGRPIEEAEEVLPVNSLDNALPRADYLVLVTPLTDETRGLMDARRLALLPRHAWLVNVGRGAIVREGDLIAALADGTLAGAVLDVFEQEPLPPESPLWGMENVIVTPHLSGPDDDRNVERFLENYRRFKASEPLDGLVDLERGY